MVVRLGHKPDQLHIKVQEMDTPETITPMIWPYNKNFYIQIENLKLRRAYYKLSSAF